MDQPVISFKLHAIELFEKSITRRPNDVPKDQIYHFEVVQNIRVNEKFKHVLVFTHVSVFSDKEKQQKQAGISVAHVYDVLNFQETITKGEDDDYKIQPDFAKLISALSVSSCRGILYSELAGTYLHSAYLPILDMDRDVDLM
jgi:hypothetical protein